MRQPVVSLERISNEENNKNINNQTPKSMIRMKQSKEQLLLNHNDIDLEKLNFNKNQIKNVDCIKDIASQNNNLEISNKKVCFYFIFLLNVFLDVVCLFSVGRFCCNKSVLKY